MDATMKGDMPPLALPDAGIHGAREKNLGASSACPQLRPQSPWFGYSLGDWLPQWDAAAQARGRRAITSRTAASARNSGRRA